MDEVCVAIETSEHDRSGTGSGAPGAPGTAGDATPPPLPKHDLPPTPPTGLTEDEAKARHAQGLGNEVKLATSQSYWQIFRNASFPQINVPLILVALFLLPFGLYTDAGLTAGPVIVNIVVSVFQEARAKQKLDQIALLTRPKATVIRGGVERIVDPAELVLGDLVVVRRGDEFVLDGTIVEGKVEVDESLLTGESDAIPKEPGEEVLSGSACLSGQATYRVERVGTESFANQILSRARHYRDERTPLQREIGKVIAVIAAATIITAFPVGFRLWEPLHSFELRASIEAAAVLVTMIPQGLAIMITVTYAAGALKISSTGAVVQRQNAVESMSRVETLCLDKTGTLTTQRIELVRAIPASMAEGAAAAATTTTAETPAGEPVAVPDAALASLLGSLSGSTTAPNKTIEAIGAVTPQSRREVADEIPFASARRWSAIRFAATVEGEPSATYLFGAPEIVLPRGHEGSPIDQRADAWAQEGIRVLVLARANDDAPLRDATSNQASLPEDRTPVALLGFAEELRPDAQATLDAFRDANVDLKVISGDDPQTVLALARRAGFGGTSGIDARTAVQGAELAQLDDAALAQRVREVSVMGRVEPALKARIVKAVRESGRYVAMVGDGVNDILSLKQANLGIAMESGSAATRGVADIVLLKDAFSVLPKAVTEGQRIVTSMQATLWLLLARTFYVLLIIAVTALLGLPFPWQPRSNAFLAMVTVGIPVLVLAVWVHPRQPPRNLLGETLRFIIPTSIAVLLVAVPVYMWARSTGEPLALSRTTLTDMTTLCGIGLITLTGSLTARRPGKIDWRPWGLAGAMLVLATAITFVPLGRQFYTVELLSNLRLVVLLGIATGWTAAMHLVMRIPLIRPRIGLAAPSDDEAEAEVESEDGASKPA